MEATENQGSGRPGAGGRGSKDRWEPTAEPSQAQGTVDRVGADDGTGLWEPRVASPPSLGTQTCR